MRQYSRMLPTLEPLPTPSEVRFCEALLEREPATPYEHVVRAHLDGRVLHFNGADCYILTPEGDLLVTSTATSPARMTLYISSKNLADKSPADNSGFSADAYLASNRPRNASARTALSIALSWEKQGLMQL